MKALLQLRDYWVEEFLWKPAPKPAEEPQSEVLPNIKVAVFEAQEGTEDYVVQLSVWLSAGRALKGGVPYQFRLVIAGRFYFVEGTPAETQQKMVYLNGASILYGIARGLLAEATSRGQDGKYILPSINFFKVLERDNSRRTAAPALPT